MLSNPMACQLRSYGFYCETTFLANYVICRGENEKDEMLFLEEFLSHYHGICWSTDEEETKFGAVKKFDM